MKATASTEAKTVARLAAEKEAEAKSKVMKKVPKKKKKPKKVGGPPSSVASSNEPDEAAQVAAEEAQAAVQALQSDNWYLRDQLDTAAAETRAVRDQLDTARSEARAVPTLEEDTLQLRNQLGEMQRQQGVWEDQRRGWEIERQELVRKAAAGGGDPGAIQKDYIEVTERLEESERKLARAQGIAREEAEAAGAATEDLENLRDKCIATDQKLAALEQAQQDALARSESQVHQAGMAAEERIARMERQSKEQLERAELESRQRLLATEGAAADADMEAARLRRRLEEEGEANGNLTEQLRDLRAQNHALEDQLRQARDERNALPSLCQHCGLPWDGTEGDSSAAMAAAAAARERTEGRDEPVITAAFGPERLSGIERAVALLREEHAKELETLGQAVAKAKQRVAEGDAQCVRLENEIGRVLELKEQAEANAARALEAMAETVRTAEERAAEAERRADMTVVSARELSAPLALSGAACCDRIEPLAHHPACVSFVLLRNR